MKNNIEQYLFVRRPVNISCIVNLLKTFQLENFGFNKF